MNIIFIGLGGALGSIFRYFLSLFPIKGDFPLNTFLTNFLGAILIGIVVASSLKFNLPEELNMFFKTGFCGGFTTFSTFSLESFELLKSNQYGLMLLYMLLSFVFCLLGVWLGMKLIK